MSEQLSNDLKIILDYAREEAIRLGSWSVSPDHLMLGIFRYRECEAVTILTECGAVIPEIKDNIEALIARGTSIPYDKASEVIISDRVKEIYAEAFNQMVPEGGHPGTAQILLAIMATPECVTGDILLDCGVGYQDVLEKIADHREAGEKAPRREAPLPSGSAGASAVRSSQSAEKGDSQLAEYGRDITKAAAEGLLDPVIGRDREIERLAQVLCRRKKNNPVLIGESGCGKSAVVEGLAQRISNKNISRALYDKRIVSLDLGSLVAGTKYRGQFEERVKAILKEVRENPDIILFIDEMHTLVGAGGSPGSLDAANLLKPALARGEIHCIGATTFDEYREIIEKDAALERRFQKIMIEPTDFHKTLEILEGIREGYEKFHNVTFTPEALKACINLSSRYISDRCLPDKAIDVMDEAGAGAHIVSNPADAEAMRLASELEPLRIKKREAALRGDFSTAAALRDEERGIEAEAAANASGVSECPPVTVTADDIARSVSTMTGIPVYKIAESDSAKLMNMGDALKGVIIGQDNAVDRLVRAIRRNRAGLKDPGKPVGTFLFLGPTGVGKTQLAKRLAEYMFGSQEDIIRIDMSEFGEKFAVSRLIGAPPGYVGYNEGGQLSEQVRRKPYSVVLLDEVEKAHPEIFNLLLQVLDEGRLTDSTGRRIDFRNTVIILTSNVGSREIKDFGGGIGYSTGSKDVRQNHKALIDKALGKVFPPEFLNRLDEQIYFNSLRKEDICSIIDLEIASLRKRMAEMDLDLQVTPEAKDFIAEVGYDPQFGARPLKRAIQRYIEDPVAEALISRRISSGPVTLIVNKEGTETVVE
ncbi:MAG: ATP-dependent Clp protease ATP-binding subunit [Bacteroidales bacterium]|nr:ATP-dependent Clp protease ATP-binding subunit [Bacteroidales bacterium]